MTNTTYNLNVSNGEANITASSSNPAELERLLQLAGAAPGDKTYSLNVNSNDERNDGTNSASINQSVNVVSKNPEDIQRLLALSGLSAPAFGQGGTGCGCGGNCQCATKDSEEDFYPDSSKACGCVGPCDCEQEVDETSQASYDQGHGKEEVETLGIMGLGNVPPNPEEKLRSPRFGSNPLAETIHTKLKSAWKDFLGEGEDEFENEDGRDSPLSEPAREKFDPDPFADKTPHVDGKESPFSEIERQKLPR